MLRVFFSEAIIFVSTLLLGIAVALRVKDALMAHIAFSSGQGEIFPSFPFPILLFYFVLGGIFAFLLTRSEKYKKIKHGIFRAFFFLAVFAGGFFSFSVFFYELALLFVFLLLLFFYIKPLVILHNLCFMVGLAGAGAVIGLSLSPIQVAFLMVLLCLYDVFSVYKTKHMVKMAREMVSAKAVMGFIIPFSLKDFFADLRETEIRSRFFVLGGGDVLMPLIFAVSFLQAGLASSLFIVFVAVIGLLFTFLLFMRFMRPIPALPPLAFALLLGYLILELEILNHIGIF